LNCFALENMEEYRRKKNSILHKAEAGYRLTSVSRVKDEID